MGYDPHGASVVSDRPWCDVYVDDDTIVKGFLGPQPLSDHGYYFQTTNSGRDVVVHTIWTPTKSPNELIGWEITFSPALLPSPQGGRSSPMQAMWKVPILGNKPHWDSFGTDVYLDSCG